METVRKIEPSLPPAPMSLEALYYEYSDMLYRLALVRTRNRQDAEDAVSEAFLRCIRKNPKFENAEHQKAWLITVTINCSKSIVTSAFRRHTTTEDPTASVCDPDRDENGVYAAVLKLPEKQRTAVHLFYYEGYSVLEIANIMASPESTVKSWLFRARQQLKEMLGDNGYV